MQDFLRLRFSLAKSPIQAIFKSVSSLRFGRIGRAAASVFGVLIGGVMEEWTPTGSGAALLRATRARMGRLVSVE